MGVFKHKPWRSKRYLTWIRTLPCACCGATPSDAHHIIGYGGTMGGKPSDLFCMPLCRIHHQMVHENRSQFLIAQVKWLMQTLDLAMEIGKLERGI